MNVSHTGSVLKKKKTAVHIQAVRFAPASGLPDVSTNHSEQSPPVLTRTRRAEQSCLDPERNPNRRG